MKAGELKDYLYSLNGGWMDPAATVDTFKAGDPQAEIRGIAVGWQSYTWALEKAVQLGCNLFVTHEPTYYNHLDRLDVNYYAGTAGLAEKQRWIESQGLVILRCHDLWDQMPEIGITDSWARLLGFSQAAVRDGYYQVHEIPETRVLDFAKRVLALLRPFGQAGIELVGLPPGAPDRLVRRVGIGTGAAAGLSKFVTRYAVDLAICTDDDFIYWRDGEYAIDHQVPVLVASHAVSEEIGIQNLARFLQQQFPEIPVHHIPQGCPYRLILDGAS